MSQGKAWDKEKVIEVLEPKLRKGYSINKACNIIGIPQSTVQTWIDNDEELRLRVNGWMNEINELARDKWIEAIKHGKPTRNGPDTYTPSKEWLERKERDEFYTKNETEHSGEIEQHITFEQALSLIMGKKDDHTAITESQPSVS